MNSIDRIDEYDALKKNLFYHSMYAAPLSKLKTHLGSALEAIESLQARIAEIDQATERCGENCICGDISDFPIECYRTADWFSALTATQESRP